MWRKKKSSECHSCPTSTTPLFCFFASTNPLVMQWYTAAHRSKITKIEGKFFKDLWSYFLKIMQFLFEIGEEDKYPELKDDSWMEDLSFLADLTGHLNKLNLQLQSERKVIDELMCAVASFSITQIKGDLTHFPNIKWSMWRGSEKRQKRGICYYTTAAARNVFITFWQFCESAQKSTSRLQDPYTFPIVKMRHLATLHVPRHELEKDMSAL